AQLDGRLLATLRGDLLEGRQARWCLRTDRLGSRRRPSELLVLEPLGVQRRLDVGEGRDALRRRLRRPLSHAVPDLDELTHLVPGAKNRHRVRILRNAFVVATLSLDELGWLLKQRRA